MTVFQLPPETRNSEGDTRGVGFELEYAGVDLRTSVAMLETLLGSEAEAEGGFRFRLPWQGEGEFKVEVDAALLHEGRYKEYLAAVGIETSNLDTERRIDDIIETLASVVVPCEIVTPPLPIDDMDVVEAIATGLRKRQARGTGKSLLYAFGLHINPEAASLEASYLRRHLQAFVVLYDWICRDSKVDFTRKLSTYIKMYPPEYLDTLLSPGYAPGMDRLIDDYMELVGSRNHALDMLPVFAHIDEERVMAVAREPELVKPRPAFHYRLANSRVDQPEWNVAGEWQYWVEVEKLAGDEQTLQRLCADYLEKQVTALFRPGAAWAAHVADTLQLGQSS